MKKKITLTKDNIKIMVCCHKPCELPLNSDGIFLPIQVGAAISNFDLGLQRDDRVNGEPCDNISAKNKSYCELTALYWAWKNIKKIYPGLKYIGLNHYRRFFTKRENMTKVRFLRFKIFSLLKYIIGKEVPQAFVPNKIISVGEIGKYTVSLKYELERELANGKQVFCTEDVRLNGASVNSFFNVVGKNNVDFLKEVIKKSDFNNYHCFLEAIADKKFCYANMFVMPYKLFCEYCELVFSILGEFEKKSNSSEFYKDVLKEKAAERLLGYFGEMLTDCFIKSQPKEMVCRLGTCFIE